MLVKNVLSMFAFMRRFFVLMFTLCSCRDPNVPPPPTGDSCKSAEMNLQKLAKNLGCVDKRGNPVGSPNSRGESYATVCERVEREGLVSMRSDCITAAKTCEEERACQAQ